MPNYTVEDIDTGKQEIVTLSIADMDQYLKDNPQKRQIITNPRGFIPGLGMKPDGVFRDMLKEIKRANPGSTIDTW